MGSAHVNGIDLAYEVHGEADGVPLLLIGGLGMQLVAWHDDLLVSMVHRGYRVMVFDNRDAGQSTHLTGFGRPNLSLALRGDADAIPYTLEDMALDTVGLLDALDVPSTHVMGVSMGGMIGQMLALQHPDRVRSLTSVMSSTGDRAVAQGTPEASAVLLAPAARTREEYADRAVRNFQVIGSRGFPMDEAWLRERAGRAWDRGHDEFGSSRQLAAVLAGGDRTGRLAGLRIPTLVVHGDADPLIPVAAGRLAASVIPSAELLEIEGMGHDLPREVWDRLLDRLDDVARRGDHQLSLQA